MNSKHEQYQWTVNMNSTDEQYHAYLFKKKNNLSIFSHNSCN